MARILITSGPTREYLDPVRYLSNGSSGRMGSALAKQAIARGHDVVLVSGPVHVDYPLQARIIRVETTAEMAAACMDAFPACAGAIAAAAPCDYRPRQTMSQKMSKQSGPIKFDLVETTDIIAELGQHKSNKQWTVAFALETHDGVRRALEKLRRKNCDLIVLNDPTAIDARRVRTQIIDPAGEIEPATGTKDEVASLIFDALKRKSLL